MMSAHIKLDMKMKSPILLVEDTNADAILLQKAFEMLEISNPIHHVRDGEQALVHLETLYAADELDSLSMPLLIILDIKLPKLNGLSVLKKVKQHEKLKKIPVVVLTTSSQTEDINTAYELGANSYLLKQVRFTDFIETVSGIKAFWLEQNQFPC